MNFSFHGFFLIYVDIFVSHYSPRIPKVTDMHILYFMPIDMYQILIFLKGSVVSILKATEVDACTYFCFCKFSLEHRPALEHQYIPTRCVSAAPSTFACTYKSYAVFSQKLVLEQYFLLAP